LLCDSHTMAPRNKQSERNASRKEGKKGDDEPSAAPMDTGDLMESVKSMGRNSCLFQHGPSLVPIVKQLSEGGKAAAKSREVDANKENNGDDNQSDDTKPPSPQGDGSDHQGLFESFQGRLAWHNSLGLFESEEASKAAWMGMKDLEVDFGPRSKKKGSPGLDRMKVNFKNHMAQYAHILLALMMLRAFFVRSYFSCLPWLFFYQFASLALPLDKWDMVPQVPLEKVPVAVRVLGTAGVHALMVLFFVYELVWCTYFFEKIPLVGLLAYHAYAVRPVGQ